MDTSAIEIAYLRRAGSGPSIVGLHGLFGSGACLLPLAEALAGDLDIILPAARGHGGTGPPAQGPQDGGNSLLRQGCRKGGWRWGQAYASSSPPRPLFRRKIEV